MPAGAKGFRHGWNSGGVGIATATESGQMGISALTRRLRRRIIMSTVEVYTRGR
jgi:hypothetical protein